VGRCLSGATHSPLLTLRSRKEHPGELSLPEGLSIVLRARALLPRCCVRIACPTAHSFDRLPCSISRLHPARPAGRVAAVWAYMLRAQANVSALPELLDAAVSRAAAAIESYAALMQSFPASVPALRSSLHAKKRRKKGGGGAVSIPSGQHEPLRRQRQHRVDIEAPQHILRMSEHRGGVGGTEKGADA